MNSQLIKTSGLAQNTYCVYDCETEADKAELLAQTNPSKLGVGSGCRVLTSPVKYYCLSNARTWVEIPKGVYDELYS